MRLRDASLRFTLWWCFTSIVIVAYVAYGTVVFSSLAFIAMSGLLPTSLITWEWSLKGSQRR